MSPVLRPAQLVVELGDHPPAPHLVEEVLGVEVAVRRLGVDRGPWMSMVTWSPSWAGRATSTSSPEVARSRSICESISSSVDLEGGQGHHQALIAGDGDRRSDHDHCVEGDRPRLRHRR